MRIESIIQRAAGTTVDLGGRSYHFKPEEPGGPHLAEVIDPEHIQRLLAIVEGFRPADGAATAMAAPSDGRPFFLFLGVQDLEAFQTWAELTIEEIGSDQSAIAMISLEEKIARGEAHIAALTIVPATAGDEPPAQALDAPDDLGVRTPAGAMSADGGGDPAPPLVPEPDATAETLEQSDDAQETREQPDDDQSDSSASADADPPADREELAQQFAEIFGHRPNGKWGAAKIGQKIAEHLAEG